MKIKSLLTCAVAAAALLFYGCDLAPAQTIATNQVPNQIPPANVQSFFTSVGDYFTSIDTNFDMHSTVEVSLDAVYQSGINFGSDFGVRYKRDLGANTGWLLESVTRNAGIAGVIVSEQAGGGFYWIKYSLELSAGLDGGYRFDVGRPAMTIYADVRKSLTPNTYAGLRAAYESDFSTSTPSAPVVGIITGFKF